MNPGVTASPPPSNRLVSVDAYRGFVMLLMMGEVLRLAAVARALPDSGFWSVLAFHQSHVEWIGCSLHDMIQPSFSFLVGVALPFSIASRRARGQGMATLASHAVIRALLLIGLGIFLRSTGKPMTNFTFEDTLTQIGLGYVFLFFLGFRPVRDQWIALGLVLAGYWLFFAMHPLPGADFDYAAVGVGPEFLKDHGLTGFAAHWQKNANAASAFDQWFMNLFPRVKPFVANGGGYLTLSFIPTLGTMILGLIAGGVLKSETLPAAKVRWLAIAGLALLGAGWLLGASGLCPVVKRIWTPSWALFSGGWCCLFLAAFYTVIDWRGWKAWTFPLMVVGMNSIAAYCMEHLFSGFLGGAIRTHLPDAPFKSFGAAYEPLLRGGALLAVLWLILFWMWRRKIFLRI